MNAEDKTTTERAARLRLKRLAEEFLECRTFGHNWNIVRDSTDIPADATFGFEWGKTLSFHCPRCGKYRFDRVNALGWVDGRKYLDVPGYHIDREYTPGKNYFRLELRRRLNESARRGATKKTT